MLSNEFKMKKEIDDLIVNFNQMIENTPKNVVKRIIEEETKIRYIIPFFEILGWDFSDYLETSLEKSSGYDEFLYKEALKKWPGLSTKFDKAKIVDCVFKINNKPYIYVEMKKLGITRLDSMDTIDGFLTLKYAKMNDVKYVVFTNFQSTVIFDPKTSLEIFSFQNSTEYITYFEKLRIISNPSIQ